MCSIAGRVALRDGVSDAGKKYFSDCKNKFFLLTFVIKTLLCAVMRSVPFHGKILLLGYGGVGRCTLPLLLKHLDVACENITVLDFAERRAEIDAYCERGVRYVQERIERETMAQQLQKYVGPGDMIIDLAWNISATDILSWCHDNGVLYVNTSVEVWDPYDGMGEADPRTRTLYVRHMTIREMIAGWKEKGPTAIIEHGANPGLVSHFTKRALKDIAERLLDQEILHRRSDEIRQSLSAEAWPDLAHTLGVKAIHISEIDTQQSSIPHDPKVFSNTWSIDGFYEEGTSPAEMGWGTHEHHDVAGICAHEAGPQNQICLEKFGIDTYVKTCVPSGEIAGMVVRHGEAFTISDFLTVRDSSGQPTYRPTVHYAYCPCPTAIASLKSLRRRKYRMQESTRIMGDDILAGGRDELGVLLMGHDLKSWWSGTILTIDEARELVPGQNATTVQVAAAVLSAVVWMIRNPAKGVLTPDLLPHEEILDIASPYLGNVVSQAIDWAPKKVTDATAWQFSSFHIPRATPRVLERAHERDTTRTGSESIEVADTVATPELALGAA